jgi:3-dehydroquinate synthase
MDALEQAVQVTFRFPVYFTTGVFTSANPVLHTLIAGASERLPSDTIAVVDDGVVRAHADVVAAFEGYCRDHSTAIRLAGPVLVLPGGEQVKNGLRYVDEVHRAIHDAALCRQSYVIAVGGGALLDAAGYAAATAHRGVRMIRIPTTVLAQDDSAVGVKNGVNAFGTKNYFGTFAPPFAVINDFSFLPTLADRDWRSGVSEAIKAALIKDAGFFADLEAWAPTIVARDARVMEQVVRRSAALHLAHIARGGDPFELGSSRPLDFGHWAAHKLELLTDHRLRHGETVGIGLALDCTYSWLSGWLPEADWRRILDLIQGIGLSVYAPELGEHLDQPDHPRSVLHGLEEFREHLGGRLTLLMLRSIGRPFEVHEVDRKVMIRSIDVLRRLEEARSVGSTAGLIHGLPRPQS